MKAQVSTLAAFGIIYFSGTGNSRLAALHLAGLLGVPARSIEEEIDWSDFVRQAERLIFVYPVHYAVPPMIMRAFLHKHEQLWAGKEIISLATQMIVSGDGARVIEDFLPAGAKLIDTQHLNMPNNIANIPFVPVTSDAGNYRKTGRAMRKLERIAGKLARGKFKRRHCSVLARKIGALQRPAGLRSEGRKKSAVWVSEACIGCGLCVRICPTHNFVLEESAAPQGDCTLCMRCCNKCPAKAITVLLNKPLKTPYPGPLYKGKIGARQVGR